MIHLDREERQRLDFIIGFSINCRMEQDAGEDKD